MAISIELVIGKWSFPFLLEFSHQLQVYKKNQILPKVKILIYRPTLKLSALCFFSISDHFFLSSFPVHLCY
jgi:hypothetical protein